MLIHTYNYFIKKNFSLFFFYLQDPGERNASFVSDHEPLNSDGKRAEITVSIVTSREVKSNPA